jgi:hypothetical protein
MADVFGDATQVDVSVLALAEGVREQVSAADQVTVSPVTTATGEYRPAGSASTVTGSTTTAEAGAVDHLAQAPTVVSTTAAADGFTFFDMVTTQDSVRYATTLSVTMRVPVILPSAYTYAGADPVLLAPESDSEGNT